LKLSLYRLIEQKSYTIYSLIYCREIFITGFVVCLGKMRLSKAAFFI